jgi:hypothetical protein
MIPKHRVGTGKYSGADPQTCPNHVRVTECSNVRVAVVVPAVMIKRNVQWIYETTQQLQALAVQLPQKSSQTQADAGVWSQSKCPERHLCARVIRPDSEPYTTRSYEWIHVRRRAGHGSRQTSQGEQSS